jgi:hypothetical protein
MNLTLMTLTTVVAFVGIASAQPAPVKEDETKLTTKVYDLKPIIGKKSASGISNVDGVLKVIFDVIDLRELKPGAGPQIIERENSKLEVHATAKIHGEIGDLIEALKRLADLAVDVKAEVIEFDPATFAKLRKTLPPLPKGIPESPVLFATSSDVLEEPNTKEIKLLDEIAKVLKEGRLIQTSSGRFVNGSDSLLTARVALQTYYPHKVNDKPTEMPQYAKEGFKLLGTPVVSADRRFVRLKLTEQSSVVTAIKKFDLGEPGPKGQRLVATSAEVADLGSTGSTTVADGGTLFFKLTYAPKDKVWVVVLHPMIYIKSEQDELKKEGKK